MKSIARPPALVSAVDAVGESTVELTRAARLGETLAIEEAIVRRDRAVRELRLQLDTHGSSLDAADRRRLLESVALQADDAQSALRRLKESAREALATQSRGSRALNGYASPDASDQASSLDREG